MCRERLLTEISLSVTSGYMEIDPEKSDSTKVYYYTKNHLGRSTSRKGGAFIAKWRKNIRNVLAKNDSGDMEEIQRTSYYPFGGIIATDSLSFGRDIQNRTYNGQGSCQREERKFAFSFSSAAEAQPKVKEQDFANNLFWLDYGARQYDPTRGQFTTPDPLAEKYYSTNYFTYCKNNPMKFIDPDGRDWILSTGDKVYWYGGEVGDNSQLLYTFKATSGNIDHQEAKFQNLKDKGPTPEGDYHINLEPDPDRVAKADSKSGALLRSPDGGIEKIPEWVDNPNKPGFGWTYRNFGGESRIFNT